jgi:hypothetical protein
MHRRSYMLINKDGSTKIIDPVAHSGPYLRIAVCLSGPVSWVAPNTLDASVRMREDTYEIVRFYGQDSIHGFVFYKQI